MRAEMDELDRFALNRPKKPAKKIAAARR